MSTNQETHLVRGVLAGIAGGLFASWVMNEFIAGPGKRFTKAVQSEGEKAQQQEHGKDVQDATMKVADATVQVITGGRHLSMEGRRKDGPIVHYGFGALMGGLYGGVAEYFPAARGGFGTSFGGALFTGADVLAVPALKLSHPVTAQPLSALATPYVAHLVYGVATELVRRILRPLL